MPTEIRASFRRTFQTKPYESEVIELTVTKELPAGADRRADALADEARELHAALAAVGDAVLLERLTTTLPPSPTPAPGNQGRQSTVRQKLGPDPYGADPPF